MPSRPNPSTLARTPTASSTRSEVTSWLLPSPVVIEVMTLLPSTLTPLTLVLVCTVDLLLAEGPGQRLRDLLVLDRHHPRHGLDDGDLDAEGVPEVGELDADGAGADHDHRLRQLGQDHRLAVGDDAVAVRLDAGQELGPRAGGDDDALGLERASCRLRPGDLHLAPPLERRQPRDVVDPYFRNRNSMPLAILSALPRLRAMTLLPVEADLALDDHAVVGRVLHEPHHLGRLEQGLGRDAAPVEADAARPFPLDTGGAAGRAGRRGWRPRSRPDPRR